VGRPLTDPGLLAALDEVIRGGQPGLRLVLPARSDVRGFITCG
jgi:hypothetical protein